MVTSVPDEVIPARFFEDGPEPTTEPDHVGVPGNTKMPPELATPPELKRGQILWIRGLTRLQTQVSYYKYCYYYPAVFTLLLHQRRRRHQLRQRMPRGRAAGAS